MPQINADIVPEWNASVEIDGVRVQLLCPDDQDEASVLARPGVLVRLKRWLLGDPQSIETDAMRRIALVVTSPDAHAFVRSLSGGQLFRLCAAYKAAQDAWTGELTRRYRNQLEPHAGFTAPIDTPSADAASGLRPKEQRGPEVRMGHDTPLPANLRAVCANPELDPNQETPA